MSSVRRDVNGDNLMDLVLGFNASLAGLKPGTTRVCVTGQTSAGMTFRGCATIQ